MSLYCNDIKYYLMALLETPSLLFSCFLLTYFSSAGRLVLTASLTCWSMGEYLNILQYFQLVINCVRIMDIMMHLVVTLTIKTGKNMPFQRFKVYFLNDKIRQKKTFQGFKV